MRTTATFSSSESAEGGSHPRTLVAVFEPPQPAMATTTSIIATRKTRSTGSPLPMFGQARPARLSGAPPAARSLYRLDPSTKIVGYAPFRADRVSPRVHSARVAAGREDPSE